MNFKVYRDCDSLRLRKIVVEIYSLKGDLLDRSRMFGGLFLSYRLSKRINRRIANRVPICQVFEQAGMGG
jgi:hypothetical protein